MSPTYKLDQLLTVQQFAAKMGVKVRTVREWVYRRVIPFTRFERRVYIDSGVVEKRLSQNSVPALPTKSDQV